MPTWWSLIAELLYKIGDYFWERREAKLKARGEPLTNEEEADDLSNLPRA